MNSSALTDSTTIGRVVFECLWAATFQSTFSCILPYQLKIVPARVHGAKAYFSDLIPDLWGKYETLTCPMAGYSKSYV